MKISRNVLLLLIILIVIVASAGGYYLWRSKGAHETHKGEQAAQGPVQYTCPMHPFIIKDKPGACPICGMTLVPIKKAEEGKPAAKEAEMLEHVSLSPTQMVMANVATTEARMASMSRDINAVGIVQYDQARQAKVTAWVA